MSNKLLLLIFLLFAAGLSHAQKQCKTYYDRAHNKVSDSADAHYYLVVDTTKPAARLRYYYPDGTLYARGKVKKMQSIDDASLQRTGKWIYYYDNGYKKEIVQEGSRRRLWYVTGATAYKSTKVYSFHFKGWYRKNKFWYANGQLQSSGLTSMYHAYKYGYYRSYTQGGRRWLEEYYAQSNLQGISIHTDSKWRIKYYITPDDISFEDASFDPDAAADTTKASEFFEAKEGYNELVHGLDTFRFTVRNGYMEGPYYHKQGEHRTYMGSYHRNYKTGPWQTISKNTYGNRIYHYEQYKKGCRHGKFLLLLNDRMLLMKGQYRYDKRVGKWLIADGAISDRRVLSYMGDEDSLYFREEKFRHGAERRPYGNVYAANKTDYSINYLWITSRKSIFTNRRITTEYYPNHKIKIHTVFNDKKKRGIRKSYDASGKLIKKEAVTTNVLK